jgi:hypothetical protein
MFFLHSKTKSLWIYLLSLYYRIKNCFLTFF